MNHAAGVPNRCELVLWASNMADAEAASEPVAAHSTIP